MAWWPGGEVSTAWEAAIASPGSGTARVLLQGLPMHGGLRPPRGTVGEWSQCCLNSPAGS